MLVLQIRVTSPFFNQATFDVGVKLFNLLESNNLYQLIEEPTQITLFGESILDFIITDSPGYFTATGTLSPPANCDHNIVFAQLNIQSPKPKAFKRMVRNFKHVNVNGLNAALIVPTGLVYSCHQLFRLIQCMIIGLFCLILS